MKKKLIAALVLSLGLLTACGGSEETTTVATGIQPESSVAVESTVESTEASSEESQEEEVIPENSYRSELTNEWISEDLANQRPIAVMVDNEKTALPHYGLTEADVVYEIMNSTANDRVTRFMAIVKDYEGITQFGSIRSARPTNFYLAVEWNAIVCHDGGPYYIDEWVARDYTDNLSGGFARFSNGKATEFTEYITYDTYTNPTTGKSYDGLKQRLEKSGYETSYNSYYPGKHWTFAEDDDSLGGLSYTADANTIKLPFPHNESTLKYNEETGTYDYYEYGSLHVDALHDNAPLTFRNVILQSVTFSQLDENGYLIYNGISTSREWNEGWYITDGKCIKILWEKESETSLTKYYDAETGEEIELNTGKTYIGYIPSDSWYSISIT